MPVSSCSPLTRIEMAIAPIAIASLIVRLDVRAAWIDRPREPFGRSSDRLAIRNSRGLDRAGTAVEGEQHSSGGRRHDSQRDEKGRRLEPAVPGADVSGAQAPGENCEIPGGNRRRSKLGRREPRKQPKTGRQDIKLAECQ